MAFKREFLITWDELAPSLQLLFNNLQTQITDNRNEITNLDQRVTDLENKNDEVFVDGSQGQFVKIDIVNHSLYAHDGFVRLRCVDNDEELQEEMKNIPLTLEEVFNSWYRYAHYNKAATDRLDFTNAPDNVPQGQNLNHTEYNIYTNKQNSGWVFDRSSQTISGTYDGCVTSGFINPTNYYTNYYLTTKVNTGWDDDNLMIIVGYTRDSKGKEHTLSIVRGAGNIGGDDFNNTWLGYGPGNGYHINCKFWWGLIYDMGNDTQFIIEDKSKETGPSSFFTKETRNAIAYITAIRSDDKFEFRTSRFSADGSDKNYVPEWNIYFQLPDSKPESWSQEMYDNIKIMLTQTNRVGFGTRSGQPSFSIEKQISIFDDEDIYALHTDTVYTWVPGEGKWVAKGKVHEILSNRIFIYYARKNYLYFYLFWNSWTKMILDPNKDILDQIKDQINNIENNITDIKGDINNINNSITNIEGDITYLSGEGDFLNLAPKIGYYQDDTVEVLSKYNMNQFEKFWAMTSTGNGEEVLYFYGSDGSYDANGKLQLFKATRQNQNSTFSFYNEPLQPEFLKGKKYYTEFNTNSYRLYAGNKWLMMSCKLETEPDSIHYYLINTKNSSDPKLWDEYKDISSIISNENIQSITNIGNFRYFPDIGVITIINVVPGGLTNTKDCGFVFSVFRYSDLKLLYQQKLPGVWELVRCDTSQYSFSTTTIESNPKASNTISQSGTTWDGSKYLFFYKSEFLGIFLNRKTCSVRVLSDNRISEESLWLELTYRIPKSLISLNPTGTITCYNTTDDFVFGTNYLYHKNTEMKNINVVSVDENNSIFNLCSYSTPSDKNPIYFYKIKDTIDQNTEGTNPKLWGRKTYYISPPNFAISPDASLWGKQIYRGVVMWDKVFLSCKSKDGDHLLVVSEFQKYKNNNNIIEPKPSSYFEIDISKNSPFGNGYFIPTSYFGSAKLENGEPCYFYTYYSSTNKQLRTVQLIYSESNKEAPVTIETLNILNLSYTIESLFVNFLQNQSQVGISYNPIGQYYIAFIQDRSNSYLNSTTRKMYFAIIKKDGSYKVFDNTYESKWCSNYSGINNSSNNYSKQGILLTLSTKDFLISDKYHNRIMLGFFRNSDNYGNYIFELVFNESFSDFTMNNLPKIGQPHKGYYSQGSANQWKIGEVSVLYNKKYGLVQYGDTWEPTNPMDFYFQKQLIQGTGTDYSFDDYYKSSKYNKYSMYLQSAQGLVCYIPNIPIFLGGYFSVIENPIQVILKANSKNYIYLERDPSNRKNIIATSSTDLTITEGSKQFSKICVACVTTDDANPIDVQYYRINTGYNDYIFNQN